MVSNQLLKQQVLIANKGKIKIKRPKKWLYPMQAERTYVQQIQAINKIFWDKVKETIIPSLPFLVAQAQSVRGDSIEKEISKLADSYEPHGFYHNGDFYFGKGTFNRDENERKAVSVLMERSDAAYVDQLKQLMDKTYLDFSKAVGKPQVDKITMEQAARISLMNKKEFVKVIHSSLSVNPIVQESWLDPKMKAFQAQNTDLITNLSIDQKQRVEQTLYRKLSAGKGIDAIKAELDKDKDIGQNRSRLIARDQTNKFNGQLTQLRQKEVGIDSYVWTTSRDERVRPSHALLDGKKFDWSNPPAEGNPGEPIQCRCIAQPVITDAMFDGTDGIEVSATPSEKPVESMVGKVSNLEIKSSFNKIAYTDKFNTVELEAIKEYQLGDISKGAKVGGYDGINGYLRTGEIPDKVKTKFNTTKSEMDNFVKAIDSTFNKSVVKSDFVVYRGMRNGDRVLNLGVGGVYNDKAYVSTSKNLAAAKKFSDGVGKNSIIMKINVGKGNEALTMNDFSDKVGHLKRENEILLPRDQKFKIKSITPIDKFLTEVEVEII